LLAHLLLFQFSYPYERSAIPDDVMSFLLTRAGQNVLDGDTADKICRGDLLSSVNYEVDIQEWGYSSGRTWDEIERTGGTNDGAGLERESPSSSVG
jgi:hypothetical protein